MKVDNILQAILHHAKTEPTKIVFSYVEGRSLDSLTKIDLTYRDLFLKAHFLSLRIQKMAKPGDRVLLCYPSGLDFIIAFYACLLAKVIAVPVVVPSNMGLAQKFAAIFEDSQPSLVLSDLKTAENYLQISSFEKYDINSMFCDAFSKTECVSTSEIECGFDLELNHYSTPTISLDDIAFLQYTSGSTSSPKGVMVTHGNLADNIVLMMNAYQIVGEDVGVSWLPHTHDMGLVGCFLLTSFSGGMLYILSQSSFIRAPIFWLTFISRFNITVAMSPNFAIDLCLKKITDNQINDLKLSSLKCFIVGAEPILATTLNKFSSAFSQCGFSPDVFAPSYGLAECTLMVSSRFGIKTVTLDNTLLNKNKVSMVKNNGKEIVSCGAVFQGVKIVNLNTYDICAEDEIGEIVVNSDSVCKGYWQCDSLTSAAFDFKLAGDKKSYFRTGDLGFMHDGELYLTGRIKEIIIMNGLNYYPHDIEQCVQKSHSHLDDASVVAFSYRADQNSATDSFVVLLKKQKSFEDAESEKIIVKVRMAILKEFQLVPHDIQFTTKSFPKTTSGKIQRNLCVEMYEELQAY